MNKEEIIEKEIRELAEKLGDKRHKLFEVLQDLVNVEEEMLMLAGELEEEAEECNRCRSQILMCKKHGEENKTADKPACADRIYPLDEEEFCGDECCYENRCKVNELTDAFNKLREIIVKNHD